MNYDEMPAGREMDALVAEKVMGIKRGDRPGEWLNELGNWLCDTEDIPPYSTSISAAWEVVDKMDCYFKMTRSDLGLYWEFYGPKLGFSYAPTVPLAICRAALKAVSNEG